MNGENENNLTPGEQSGIMPTISTDPLGKMCDDILRIVRERGPQYGVMYYPTMKNPAIAIKHGHGKISQVDILFEEAKFDEEDNIILPAHRATYRQS